MYFWLRWVFVAAQGLHLSAVAGGSGFSSCRTRALGTQASLAVVRGHSCPVVCGNFPDQESNTCPLR